MFNLYAPSRQVGLHEVYLFQDSWWKELIRRGASDLKLSQALHRNIKQKIRRRLFGMSP